MPDFVIQKRLPSCFVDKGLVKALEDYIRTRVNALPWDPDAPDETEHFSVEIVDAVGTETLESVVEHGPGRFFDGTKDITLKYFGYRPGHLEMTVRFSVDRENSVLRVQYSGEAAREIVVGLVIGIETILMPTRTMNRWFCPH